MSLLLFTLFSTALALPAHPCPPFPPTDCGEGMRSCPGEFDPQGCRMPETCVAEGDECPFICPHVEHPHCGFVMSNCAGPVDENGCETPMNCVMVDWAAGEQCPPPEEAAAASCPPWSPVDCGVYGEGMINCPGPFDHMGCPMNDMCLPAGESCPHVCPHVKHPHCGFVMSNCEGPRDEFGCETPMNCVMVDWAAGEQCPPPEEAAAASCPPWTPIDCGEGMKSCPGQFEPRGCPMPDICIAEGESCPHVCPHVKHPHCGFVMGNCEGPRDEFGCETPMYCVMVDWAAGEQCPAPEDAAAASCPPWSPTDCGKGDQGQGSCVGVPSGYDARGCPMPDICSDSCP